MDAAQNKFPPNPYEKANFLSKIFFCWTVPFFKHGYRKPLKLDDMYEPLKCDKSDSLGNRLEKNWNKVTSNTKRSSLRSAIYATFWKEYIILAVFTFCNECIFRLGQPFLLSYLLQFFREGSDVKYQDAFMYASGIVLMNALNAIFGNHLQNFAFHIGMKVRVAVCSLIYRKALRLSHTALGETSAGKMVNLLSNDVNRFEWASFFMNYLWVSPLLTITVCFLMWFEVGPAGLVGILVVFTIVPILSYSGKLTSKYRLKTALKTDERVRFMDEIISGVQVIKMYAWEKPFASLVSAARKMELQSVRKTSYIRACHMTSMLFTTRLALFCTMLTILLIYGPEKITAARIFAITSYFTITSHLMSQRFSRSIAEVSEVSVALDRLDKFLNLEEKNVGDNNENAAKNGTVGDKRKGPHLTENTTIEDPNSCISIRNATARWMMPSKDSSKSDQNGGAKPMSRHPPTLDNLNIEFPNGKLIGVIGAVGSGKSSLLQVILRELPLESGSIKINGSISYASQEPWIFAASVRQNILFGQEFDHERYNAVVRTCALTKDFEQFADGDQTIVGERGASLSGGQKARINLARACYRDSDIYLFDDPLSAVDSHVGTHIFHECLGPNSRLARRHATRILVTHQVHFLKEADWIIVLKDGKIEIQGSPEDLYRSDVDFVELFGKVETPAKQNTDQLSRQKSEPPPLSTKNGTQHKPLNAIKDKGVPMEESTKGKIKGSISIEYFKAGAHWSILLFLLFTFLSVQFLASGTDYWVSVWIRQEELRQNSSPMQEQSSSPLSTETCIYIQASLVVGLLIFGLTRSIVFYEICVNISKKIHKTMFKGIISTSMRFFETNPSGRLLNRFSKDIGAIDEILPKSMLDSTQNILTMLGSITIAVVINPYLLIPILILTIAFAFLRRIYLKTSKEVKRLEGTVKSPAFTHLAATLNGLSTVRAFNAEEILKKEFDLHQDTHTACWFMVFSSMTAFGFFLDIICTIFCTCIVFYYILFDNSASGEKVGLAISQAMSLIGFVPWGVRQSAEVSNQLTAVERALEYRDLKPEKQPTKPLTVPTDWPSKGRIEFRNVFFRYFAEAEPVLRDLSFVIRPMEKIGIVGRTGAGKSSLIGAIFRLACVEGEILIDGIDTANIRLSELRKNIAIIPQDPVLFSGTLRRNLDPFEEYSDADIWNALESVEMKEHASDASGLQTAVLPHGSNFSVGQRQLLCLARAILRKSRILMMDECTANVDSHTDLLIQQTIREKFTECTILTIAHRLHTIIDSDRVIVMDSGRLTEFDRPHTLLQNEIGIFHGMVKALGDHEFDRLSRTALEKFNSHPDDTVEDTSL